MRRETHCSCKLGVWYEITLVQISGQYTWLIGGIGRLGLLENPCCGIKCHPTLI
jgi:hypothetical protein